MSLLDTLKDLVSFETVLDWLKALNEVADKTFGGEAHGVRVLVQAQENGYVSFKHCFYYKQEGQWYEEITTRKVEVSEVPAVIMEDVTTEEKDLTQKIKELWQDN